MTDRLVPRPVPAGGIHAKLLDLADPGAGSRPTGDGPSGFYEAPERIGRRG